MADQGLRIGCFPGSFNPPTVAHLAVAEAAVRAAGLDRIDLVLSRVALGKEDVSEPTLDQRAAVLAEVAATRPWLGVAITDARLIVDIAEAYDAVVMGADKWRQVTDPAWYGDDPSALQAIAARDAAVARLPQVLVVPRAGDRPDEVAGVMAVLEIDEAHAHVSASEVRSGAAHAADWILPEARRGSDPV
ncbi:hypothetical protein [Aquihabitans sp. McL0605]|uniref:hypothetical protein n=1 Tax=Aquihabitans sp. McL0605 TaxID=3415671 RepID=UPI003CF946BD